MYYNVRDFDLQSCNLVPSKLLCWITWAYWRKKKKVGRKFGAICTHIYLLYADSLDTDLEY